MEKNMIKRKLGAVITAAMMLTALVPSWAYGKTADTAACDKTATYTAGEQMRAASSESKISSALDETGGRLIKSAVQNAPTVSSIGGEWMVMGLARSGRDVPKSVYTGYLTNLSKELKDKNGVLHDKKYTEYSRVILALTSIGEDVTNAGGYNLLKPLADYEKTIWQGINGAIFALIAFDTHDYDIPQADSGAVQTTREKLINHILEKQLGDGGWVLSGKTSDIDIKADIDITAMAIQSLAPYYDKDKNVKNAVDKAVARLSEMQNKDGGYASWGAVNSESCSQVIVALTALGIDPDKDERFVKSGKSVVDALLGFKVSGGGFEHVKGDGFNLMATEQGYYALVAYSRYLNGKASLYNMSDVMLKSDKEKIAEVEKSVDALPAELSLSDKDDVKNAEMMYELLNPEQKKAMDSEKTSKLYAAVKRIAQLEMDSVKLNAKAVSLSYNKIKLTWNSVKAADKYQIYRASSGKGKYSLVATTGKASFTDTGLKTGRSYYYKVRACKTAADETIFSGFSSVKTAKPKLAKVANVKATAGKKKAVVSYKKVAGANGYEIYRSTAKNGKYKLVKTVKTGSTVKFTNSGLKSGKTYYYKVRAYRNVDGGKVYGAYGNKVKATIK